MSTAFERQVAGEFADAIVNPLIEAGVPKEIAEAQKPGIAEAFLELVADGAIHVLEDGILIRDASRLEAIVLAGVGK